MKLLSVLLLFTTVAATSNGAVPHDEDWESKTYEIGDFTEIYLEGGYEVFLVQGDESKIIVKADDYDVFDDLSIRNTGDRLKVKVERDHFNCDRIKLYITFKTLTKLHIEGGVKLNTKGYLNLNDFEMYVSGGAKIELDMKADAVKIYGEGGILFELDGIAKSLDITISGAGHIDAGRLKSEKVSIKIEGVGSGSVYATETLYAEINGIGKINYRGEPKVTRCIDGIGSVKRD